MALGKTVAAALLLFAGSLALFAATVAFGFVKYDDYTILLDHPNLYGGESLLQDLRQIFGGYLPREEPLLVRDVTWAVESRLFGMTAAWPRHLGNVVLNAANAALAFLYLKELTGRARLAFGCALAWSLLAVHAEPVAWVMGRKDMLCAFFALGVLALEAHAPRLRSRSARAAFYVAGLAGTAAAVLSKMGGLSLFGALMLQHYLRGQVDPSLAGPAASLGLRALVRSILRYLPHTAVSLAIGAWYSGVLQQSGVIGHRGPGLTLGYAKILVDLLPLVAAEYAQLLAFPFGLSISHAWPSLSVPLTSTEIVASRAALVAMLAITVGLARWRRDLLFYWLAAWAFMATYLNLVYIGIWVADRYLYIPSLFLVALLGTLAARAFALAPGFARAAVAGLVGGVLLLNAVQTVLHQRVWSSNESLWTYETSLPTPSLLSFHGLAKEYLDQAAAEPDSARRAGLLDAAQRTLARGIEAFARLDPKETAYYTSERHYLSKFFFLRGRALELAGAPLEQQLAAYQQSQEADPMSAVAAMGVAQAFFNLVARAEGPQREEWARQSLASFDLYARWAAGDAVQRRAARKMLEDNYGSRFPFLEREVAALRQILPEGQ